MTATEQRTFGERHFGNAQLGDQRRTRRLVKIADQMVLRPSGSWPEKINSPGDLKAAYRMLDSPSVTHQTVLESSQRHLFDEVLPAQEGFTLLISDSTELEYTGRHSLASDLGQIGNGFRRGFIAQNVLAVNAHTGKILGLANQVLHCRPHVRKGETKTQRQKRDSRESLLWLKAARGLPSGRHLVDVCDRGADTLEFLEYENRSGRTFLIRSSQNRNCLAGHDPANLGDRQKLHDYARQAASLGVWNLEVTSKVEFKSEQRRGKKRLIERTQRTAQMAASVTTVSLKTSRGKSAELIPLWVVRVWELHPPQGEAPLEWFLLTNHPVETFADAQQVTGWYEARWKIEEYHKCLKTGMSIEDFQFTDRSRLEPAIALTSITAITLLNLRDDSRDEQQKHRLAREYLDPEYVEILSLWRHGELRHDWTVSEFVLALARLAGHQNRRSDHPPGWQKLWKGWRELHGMLIGARLAKKSIRSG